MVLELLLALAGITVTGHWAPLSIYAPAVQLSVREALSPTIAWDQSSLTQVSSQYLHHAGYARLIEVHDGRLLCVYEGDGSIFATRSEDGGASWEEAVPVAWRQGNIHMTVPDVLELQDGSILVCYNPRPNRRSPKQTFGIRTRKSYDGGRTWIHGRLLYEAGTRFTDGCWEPAALQLPDGEIQLFFADEKPFRGEIGNDQNISLFRSHDGGLTWSEKPEVVACKRPGRDGMPVPLLLQNGCEMVCAIEQSVAGGSLQPALIRSSMERNWKGTVEGESIYREEPLRGRLKKSTYAGAPYIRQLGTGHTLLSYQGTQGRGNRLHRAMMRVLVGDSRARNFVNETVPFSIPADRFGLWNSVNVLRDDTIVALTSTNAFSPKSQVWMIKGRLVDSPVRLTLRKCFTGDGDSGSRHLETGN